MVDFTFLRKRRVRKVALIIGTISLAGAVVVGAVAALGQHAAPLTVKLNNSNVSLGLTSEESSNAYQAFLIGSDAGKSVGYTEFTEKALPKDSALDSEITNFEDTDRLTSDGLSFKYYKYTFYVTNTGEQAAEYEIAMNINRSTSDTKEFDLTNILRVRVFENSDFSQHNCETFAKAKSFRNETTGQLEYTEELISNVPGEYATKFVDSKTVMRRDKCLINPGEKIRYTFVLWLEGYDDDSNGVPAPKNSSLALGVNISAHEG